MNLNGMQVVVITQPGLQNKQMAHIRIKPRLAKQLIGLGVVHILNGVFCIIYQSISLEIYVNATSYIGPDSIVWLGHGFWCGLSMTTVIVMASMLVATGILEFLIAIWSSIVCYLIGVCNCCLASTPQTQPLILSAEQQAALMMSNPMVIQQQSMGGFRPQHQMLQHNKQQPNVPQNAYKNLISGATVEGYYTDLNTGLRCNRPSSDVDVSGCITTSIYEELHEYEEVEPASKL